jgi:hypothetical protein
MLFCHKNCTLGRTIDHNKFKGPTDSVLVCFNGGIVTAVNEYVGSSNEILNGYPNFALITMIML